MTTYPYWIVREYSGCNEYMIGFLKWGLRKNVQRFSSAKEAREALDAAIKAGSCPVRPRVIKIVRKRAGSANEEKAGEFLKHWIGSFVNGPMIKALAKLLDDAEESGVVAADNESGA